MKFQGCNPNALILLDVTCFRLISPRLGVNSSLTAVGDGLVAGGNGVAKTGRGSREFFGRGLILFGCWFQIFVIFTPTWGTDPI